MLKTTNHENVLLVTQPDHAQVAAYLAAHWGNDEFTKPGFYATTPDAEDLRAEVIFAIAQHDNGWWEWEATPDLADIDGFPSGLAEVLKEQQAGMNRWRSGLTRFADRPYVNLLISHHAHWLYAAKVQPSPDPAFIHPLFWNRDPEQLFPGAHDQGVAFIAELETLRQHWIEELTAEAATTRWVDPDHLQPHGRLLQLLDGLSLSLCSDLIPARIGTASGFGKDEFELHQVPRHHWDDRVTIEVSPLSEGRIILDPFPFDMDPLPVNVPVRTFESPTARSEHFESWWNARPLEILKYVYISG